MKFRYIGVIVVACMAMPAFGADKIPTAKPESVGMSSERLQRINVAMRRHIDAGNIQGAVTVVARHGKVVHFETHGLMDVDNQRPMQRDAIFRMASSTKPILAVAALMMIEEGLLRPSDRVSKYIPEFVDLQVAVLAEPTDKDISPYAVKSMNPDTPHRLVPAAREITIQDLLTHTSGLASNGLGMAVSPRPIRGPDATLASVVPSYAGYALDFQPGSRWSYSASVGLNVVARIIEIVSGTPFDKFLAERIFDPLGMQNTYFNVPQDKRSQRVKIHGRDMSARDNRPPTKFFSASGGLSSTAEDYLRFEQMLLNGGELFGNRLLGPRSIRMMSSNHVGALYQGLARNQEGMGYGYAVAVVMDPIAANNRRSKGAFGWAGAYGTQSWTEPAEELTAVLMLQQPFRAAQYDFGNAVQQAIIE